MCNHLKGDGKTPYSCTLLKRKCPYQRYCSEQHKYTTSGCSKCPAFKENAGNKK